jgi:hypothetical protein
MMAEKFGFQSKRADLRAVVTAFTEGTAARSSRGNISNVHP